MPHRAFIENHQYDIFDTADLVEREKLLEKVHVYNAVDGLYRFVFVLVFLLPLIVTFQTVSLCSTAWSVRKSDDSLLYRYEVGLFAVCPHRILPYCSSWHSAMHNRSFSVYESNTLESALVCQYDSSTSKKAVSAVWGTTICQLVFQAISTVLLCRITLRVTAVRTIQLLALLSGFASALGLATIIIFVSSTTCSRKTGWVQFELGQPTLTPFHSGSLGWGIAMYITSEILQIFFFAVTALFVLFLCEVKSHANVCFHKGLRSRWVQSRLTQLSTKDFDAHALIDETLAAHLQRKCSADGIQFCYDVEVVPSVDDAVNINLTFNRWNSAAPHSLENVTPLIAGSDDWVYNASNDLFFSAKRQSFYDEAACLYFNDSLEVWQTSVEWSSPLSVEPSNDV